MSSMSDLSAVPDDFLAAEWPGLSRNRVAVHLSRFAGSGAGTVVALGFFDGVHVGHRCLLERALASCEARAGEAWAFTFSNHPALLVRPTSVPHMLTSFVERITLLSRCGVNCVYREFDREWAALSPREFASRVLRAILNARVVIVGPNYNFGRGAAGTPKMLAELGEELGFRVVVVPAVSMDGNTVSSSLIRRQVSVGELERASRLLGQPYSLASCVIHGRAYGRTVGIPTANIVVPSEKVAPGRGVYAVWAGVNGVLWPGLAYYGNRPTFAGDGQLLEVNLAPLPSWCEVDARTTGSHLCAPADTVVTEPLRWGDTVSFRDTVGFDNLYGRRLRVHFVRKLRDERRFAGPSELVAQIAKDREMAGRFLTPASRGVCMAGLATL